jgi:hypothetical protein
MMIISRVPSFFIRSLMSNFGIIRSHVFATLELDFADFQQKKVREKKTDKCPRLPICLPQ